MADLSKPLRIMKRILILLLALMVSSCAAYVTSLKGNYVPYVEMASTIPFEELWDNAIDAFVYNEIPIRTIDKESGLLVSDVFVSNKTTIEKDGKAKNNDMWYVVPNYYGEFASDADRQYDVSAQLIIRIRERKEDDVCTLHIGLTNMQCNVSTTKLQVKSTGTLEKSLLMSIAQ